MKAKTYLWARRAITFVLSFVMAIGGVPAQAFAAPAAPAQPLKDGATFVAGDQILFEKNKYFQKDDNPNKPEVVRVTNKNQTVSWSMEYAMNFNQYRLEMNPDLSVITANESQGSFSFVYVTPDPEDVAHDATTLLVSGTGTQADPFTFRMTGYTVFEPVNLAPNVVEVEVDDATYNGGSQLPFRLTYAGSELVAGTDYEVTALTKGGESVGAAVDAGDYVATLTAKEGSGYTGTRDVSFRIDPTPVTVKANDQEITYGQAVLDLTITKEPADTTVPVATTKVDVSEKPEAGTYPITFEGIDKDKYNKPIVSEDGNYAITYVPGTLTVNSKKITVTAIGGTKKYGDTDPSKTLSVDESYKQDLEQGDTLTFVVDRVPGEAPGEYAVYFPNRDQQRYQSGHAGSDAPNYEVTFVDGKLQIEHREVYVTPVFATKVVDDPDPEFSAKVEGDFVNGETVSYSVGRAVGQDGEDVGKYDLQAYGDEWQGGYHVTFNSLDDGLRIAEKLLTFKADDKTKAYGDNDPMLTVTGDAQFLYDRELWPPTAERDSGEDVGKYDIRFDVSNLPSGSDVDTSQDGKLIVAYDNGSIVATFEFGTFTITPREVTVVGIKGVDKVYDGTSDAWLDCTGAVVHELADNEDIGIKDELGINVAVNAKGEFKNANAGIGKTIDISEIWLETVPDGYRMYNYVVVPEITNSLDNPLPDTQTETEADICKRPVKVTIEDCEKVYGDEDPEFKAKVQRACEAVDMIDVVEEEEGFMPSGLIPGDAIWYNLSRTRGEDVGSYTIRNTLNADQGNYLVTFVNGKLDITKRPVAVQGIEAKDKTYDGTDAAELDCDAAEVLGVLDRDAYGVTVTAKGRFDGKDVAWEKGQPASKKVAVDSVRLAGRRAFNYALDEAESQTEAEAKILPREATVTPDDKAKTYGQADPALTATVEGLLGSDTVAYELTRESGEDAGEYAITAAGEAAQGNYTVTFGKGAFTINRKKVTVTPKNLSKTYGNKDPELTAKVRGTVNGDTVKYRLVRQTGEDAGTYAVRASGKEAQGNYEVAFKDGTFTIRRRKVTVAARDLSKYYRAKDPKLTAKVTGTVKGETVTYKLKRAKGQKVGTYKVKATGKATQGNYEVTYKDGKLTINDLPRLKAEYSVRRAGDGWTHGTYDGDFSGSTVQGRQIEELTAKVPDAPYAGGIKYRASVQNKGWGAWKKDGAIAGTWDHYIEAVQIKLYGTMAKHFDVYYRVHVKNYGWMAWAKNGKTAGTTGQSRRAEALQVVILRKGSKAPSKNYKGVAQTYKKASE